MLGIRSFGIQHGPHFPDLRFLEHESHESVRAHLCEVGKALLQQDVTRTSHHCTWGEGHIRSTLSNGSHTQHIEQWVTYAAR